MPTKTTKDRNDILTVGLLLLVPLAASCGRVAAQPTGAAASSPAVIGVAGSCPAGAGPMRPAPEAMMDLNRDGYVCPIHFRSITGETLDLMVDNDVAVLESVLPEPYIGM